MTPYHFTSMKSSPYRGFPRPTRASVFRAEFDEGHWLMTVDRDEALRRGFTSLGRGAMLFNPRRFAAHLKSRPDDVIFRLRRLGWSQPKELEAGWAEEMETQGDDWTAWVSADRDMLEEDDDLMGDLARDNGEKSVEH